MKGTIATVTDPPILVLKLDPETDTFNQLNSKVKNDVWSFYAIAYMYFRDIGQIIFLQYWFVWICDCPSYTSLPIYLTLRHVLYIRRNICYNKISQISPPTHCNTKVTGLGEIFYPAKILHVSLFNAPLHWRWLYVFQYFRLWKNLCLQLQFDNRQMEDQ